MNPEDYSQYLYCMELIKARIAIIDQINGKHFTTKSPKIDIEILCLQYRIIFELIALSSLCSHKESYEKVRASFSKEWKAAKIIKTVESLNPEFFPVPFEDDKRDSEGRRIIDYVQNDSLTKSELTKFHGMSGNYLHQSNPYDKEETLNPFIGNDLRDKIVRLLNKHLVWLYHESKMILVLMNTIPDGKITIHPLELTGKSKDILHWRKI